MQVGLTSGFTIIAITLATVVSVASGEKQPLIAKVKTTQSVPVAPSARSPKTVEKITPLKSDQSSESPPHSTSIDPPAPRGSTSPALAAESPTTFTKEHEILMTWLAPGKSGGRLQFARLSGQTWSQPITVAEPVSMLDPSDRPSLTVIDTQGVRRTLIARTGDVVARSGDGGRTWGRLPASPLPFASFAGGDEGGYAFWLAASENSPTKLLGTRVLAGETLLDSHVLGGSSTSAAMTWDGPVVVYRAPNVEGSQAINIVGRQNAEWTEPRAIHIDGWQPAQNPKNGPDVAALRRLVAVAWYTEASGRPQVLVAFSHDAGKTFSTPVEVDAKNGDHTPQEPVAVTLDDKGHALLAWMATTGPMEATLNLARVSSDGQRGAALVLTKAPPSRLGGIPQIVLAEDRVAVTWLEGVLRRVRVAAVPLTDIPALGSRPRLAAASKKSRPPSGRGQVGDFAPDRALISLDGDTVSLASLHGSPVLLNLWATWCQPCIHEMPELAALHESYRKKGLVVVGVNVDSADASDDVHAFVSKLKIPFAVWLDPEMLVSKALRVRGLPATFVIDRGGQIVLRRDRAIAADDPELGEALSRVLNDS